MPFQNTHMQLPELLFQEGAENVRHGAGENGMKFWSLWPNPHVLNHMGGLPPLTSCFPARTGTWWHGTIEARTASQLNYCDEKMAWNPRTWQPIAHHPNLCAQEPLPASLESDWCTGGTTLAWLVPFGRRSARCAASTAPWYAMLTAVQLSFFGLANLKSKNLLGVNHLYSFVL